MNTKHVKVALLLSEKFRYQVISVLIAATVIVGAVTKIANPDITVLYINSHKIIPEPMVVYVILIHLGFTIVPSYYLLFRKSYLASLILLAVLIISYLYTLTVFIIYGPNNNCGCYPGLLDGNTIIYTLISDLVLIYLCVTLVKCARRRERIDNGY